MSSAGVDTSSIYDSLRDSSRLGGVALRRVVATTPQDVFGHDQAAPKDDGQDAAPKFSRISVTARYPVEPPVSPKSASPRVSAAVMATSPKRQEELAKQAGRFVPMKNLPDVKVIEKKGELVRSQVWRPTVDSGLNRLSMRAWDADNRQQNGKQAENGSQNEVRAVADDDDDQHVSVRDLKKRYEDAKEQANGHDSSASTENGHSTKTVDEGQPQADRLKSILKHAANGTNGTSLEDNRFAVVSTTTTISQANGGISQQFSIPGDTPSAKKLMGDQRYKFTSSRNQAQQVPGGDDELVIEMESIDVITTTTSPTGAKTASRRFNFFVPTQRQGIIYDKVIEADAASEAAAALDNNAAASSPTSNGKTQDFGSKSEIVLVDDLLGPSGGLSSKMSEQNVDEDGPTIAETSAQNSALTESDIEDFNEILDGTKNESDRLSPAEIARVDSLRSSLRRSRDESDDDDDSNDDDSKDDGVRPCWQASAASISAEEDEREATSANRDDEGQTINNSSALAAGGSGNQVILALSAADGDLAGQLPSGSCGNGDADNGDDNDKDGDGSNELLTNDENDKIPVAVCGLDDYELTKRRLQQCSKDASVHWKQRFSRSNSQSPEPQRSLSPKEAVSLLMEDTDRPDSATAPPRKIDFHAWDARPLLRCIYAVRNGCEPADTAVEGSETGNGQASPQEKHVYVNMEGFLERLLHGGRQTGLLKTWRRKYIRLCDGTMYISEKSTDSIHHYRTDRCVLAGAVVRACDEPGMLTVEESSGKWTGFRCLPEERDKWLAAFESQAVDLTDLFDYLRPVTPSGLDDIHDRKVLIVDVGECSLRAGVLRNHPALPDIFSPAVGGRVTSADSDALLEMRFTDDAYGPLDRQHKIAIQQPFKMSVSGEKSVTDFACLSGLLTKVITTLNVNPADFSLFLTIPFEIGVSEREQLDKVLHGLGFSKNFVSPQEPLVLYAYGCTDAVIVHIGEHTSVMPVVSGCAMIAGSVTLPYGGHDLVEAFNSTLPAKHICTFSTAKELLIARYLAEHLCYVAENYQRDLNTCLNAGRQAFDASADLVHCQLPPGLPTRFNADWGRFHASERIANPGICFDAPSLAQLVFSAIRACPIDSRRDLYRNIVLSGGPTCLPGFVERLEADIRRLLPSNTSLKVRVNRAPFAYHAPFVGATVLAAKPEFTQLLTSTSSSSPIPPRKTY